MELSHNYWRYRSKADLALKEIIVFWGRQTNKQTVQRKCNHRSIDKVYNRTKEGLMACSHLESFKEQFRVQINKRK